MLAALFEAKYTAPNLVTSVLEQVIGSGGDSTNASLQSPAKSCSFTFWNALFNAFPYHFSKTFLAITFPVDAPTVHHTKAQHKGQKI